jgi:hypothetical protein
MTANSTERLSSAAHYYETGSEGDEGLLPLELALPADIRRMEANLTWCLSSATTRLAAESGRTIAEVALEETGLGEEQLRAALDPASMLEPGGRA